MLSSLKGILLCPIWFFTYLWEHTFFINLKFVRHYCNFFTYHNILPVSKWHIFFSQAKHSRNVSHNFVLQLYLIKCTLSFFCLGWTHHLCLVGTAAMLISSLFASLFLPRDLHPEATRNYTSFSLDPTLTKIWEHLRRDDANPPEDFRWC